MPALRTFASQTIPSLLSRSNISGSHSYARHESGSVESARQLRGIGGRGTATGSSESRTTAGLISTKQSFVRDPYSVEMERKGGGHLEEVEMEVEPVRRGGEV